MKILSFLSSLFQKKKNYAEELFERKKTVPHKTVHYDWQLKENYEHLTGRKLELNKDTSCYAQKATYCEVNKDGKTYNVEIAREPVKHDGIKKSSTGLITIFENGDIKPIPLTNEYISKIINN